MLGSRDTKGSPPTRKKRNEHRFQRGEPRELVKWRKSSLNLALEPKTPRGWTCAQWIASTRRSEEPMKTDGRTTLKCAKCKSIPASALIAAPVYRSVQ